VNFAPFHPSLTKQFVWNPASLTPVSSSAAAMPVPSEPPAPPAPPAVSAVPTVAKLEVGSRVMLLSDRSVVMEQCAGHGGWTDAMAPYLGASGVVNKVDKDGDVYVTFDKSTLANKTWCWNPASFTPAGPASKPTSSSVLVTPAPAPPPVPGLMCLQGHKLTRFCIDSPNYVCDSCPPSRSKLTIGTWVMSCRPCGHDVCDRCSNV
jgi:hypothetical protein